PRRFGRGIESGHGSFQLVEPGGIARKRPRRGDQALHERLEVAQGRGRPGAAEEAERRQQRRERERQFVGRAAGGHRSSSSSESGGYSTKSASRISYSRSQQGARLRPV